jgi:tRNA(fMet)-specific endonuclease VapC
LSLLLDTTVCVDVLRGHARVCARLSGKSPAECAISSVTAFELMAGVRRCAQPERELKKLRRFLGVIEVVPFDEAAAGEAARMRHELESKGEKIGPYDLLIAGQAVAGGHTLVTSNTREFARIASLPLVDWRS